MRVCVLDLTRLHYIVMLHQYLGLNAQPDIQTLTGLLWHITSLEIASSRHSE